MSRKKSEERRQNSEAKRLCTIGGRTTDDSSLVPRPLSSGRNPKDFQASVVCFLLSVFCLLSGCQNYDGGENYHEVQVTPAKLQQVETLDLQKAEDEQSVRADANEPAPAELELTLEQCRALTLENNLDLKVQLITAANQYCLQNSRGLPGSGTRRK